MAAPSTADSFFDGSGYIQDVRGTCARLYQQVAGLRQQVRTRHAVAVCVSGSACVLRPSKGWRLCHLDPCLSGSGPASLPCSPCPLLPSALSRTDPLVKLPLSTPQVHGLEQEVAAAVDTSARLQRQRANLTTTLDVLRAMEGVAQVGGEHTDTLKRLFAWGSEQPPSALGSRHTVAPNRAVTTSPAPFLPGVQAQSALQGLLPQGGGIAADYAGAIDVLEVLQVR